MAGSGVALSEQDYEAIEAAVMETARGRWFLAEYARRHRSADTGAVLEAITRMEARLGAPAARPVALPSLGAVLEALTRGRQELAGLGPLPTQASLFEPVTAGTSVAATSTADTSMANTSLAERLKDRSWSLRATGADDEACDLIERCADDIAVVEARLLAVTRQAQLASGILDMLHGRLEELDGTGAEGEPDRPRPGARVQQDEPALDAAPPETAAPDRGALAEVQPAGQAVIEIAAERDPVQEPTPFRPAPLRMIQPWHPPAKAAVPLLALPAPSLAPDGPDTGRPLVERAGEDIAMSSRADRASGLPDSEDQRSPAGLPIEPDDGRRDAIPTSDIVLPAIAVPRPRRTPDRPADRRAGVSLAEIEALSFEDKAALFS